MAVRVGTHNFTVLSTNVQPCAQATGVDVEGKKVMFKESESISYDVLLLATGSK